MSDAEIELFIRGHLRAGDIAIDVGANSGRFSLVMAEAVGRHGRVFAFEPADEPRAILTQLAPPQVEILPLAVAESCGFRSFHIDMRPKLGHVASSLFVLDDIATQTVERTVECTTLDVFCAERHIAPTLIKVDAEGADPLVLAGAHGVIDAHRPAIVYELWETWWDRGHADLWTKLERDYDLRRMPAGADVSNVVATPRK